MPFSHCRLFKCYLSLTTFQSIAKFFASSFCKPKAYQECVIWLGEEGYGEGEMV
jgi:hypothetical protein